MLKRLKRLVKGNKGLALSELMVATALLSMVVVGVGNVYSNSQQSYYYLEGSSKNIQEARMTADQLTKDLRTTIQISSASGASVTVSGDYDGNGVADTITYTKTTGGILNRTIGSLTTEIASGIVNSDSQPIFKYYEQDGVAVTDGTQAKLIEIDLRIDKDTQRSPSRSTQLITKIQLRNLHERR